MFMLTCHPFLSGRAGRIEALRILIEAGLERGDVEFRNALQLANATLQAADAPRRALEPVTVSDADFPEW
jgi:hypothetical protein